MNSTKASKCQVISLSIWRHWLKTVTNFKVSKSLKKNLTIWNNIISFGKLPFDQVSSKKLCLSSNLIWMKFKNKFKLNRHEILTSNKWRRKNSNSWTEMNRLPKKLEPVSKSESKLIKFNTNKKSNLSEESKNYLKIQSFWSRKRIICWKRAWTCIKHIL